MSEAAKPTAEALLERADMSEPSARDRERQLRHAVAVGPFPPIQYWGDEVKFLFGLLDVARAEVVAAREEGRREAAARNAQMSSDADNSTPRCNYVTIDLDGESGLYTWEINFGDSRLNRCGSRETVESAIDAVCEVIARERSKATHR